MLTKEECLRIFYNIRNGLYARDDVLSYGKLIQEHFDNPPLKLEELKDSKWYWCEAYGWCLMNFYEDLHGKIHYKANTVSDNEIDLLVEFEENRFYRKQVEE